MRNAAVCARCSTCLSELSHFTHRADVILGFDTGRPGLYAVFSRFCTASTGLYLVFWSLILRVLGYTTVGVFKVWSWEYCVLLGIFKVRYCKYWAVPRTQYFRGLTLQILGSTTVESMSGVLVLRVLGHTQYFRRHDTVSTAHLRVYWYCPSTLAVCPAYSTLAVYPVYCYHLPGTVYT